MKVFINTLLLLISVTARLGAQGICDSIVTINPVLPLCQGTGYANLKASHPGGVFSGPGLAPNSSYLDAENLSAGFYTIKYTLTGPGGCTVEALRQVEVRPANEAFAFANGTINCANPNSTATLDAFPAGGGNYFGVSWSGPPGSAWNAFNWAANTPYAGTHRFRAYSSNTNECPIYAKVEVSFNNAPANLKIVSCTDCSEWNGNPPVRIKLDTVPPGWDVRWKMPNGAFTHSAGCLAISQTGLWQAELINNDNGCFSKASANLDRYATPSVSAGSNLGLYCGMTGHFITATNPNPVNAFDFYWTTPSNDTVPAAWATLVDVTEEGNYVLHGVNRFTGCMDTDTAFAKYYPLPGSTQIVVLCDGESFNGHTQSGTYVDNTTLANGCIKQTTTKILVLAPIQDSVAIEPDFGQMSGSLEVFVLQGWPPFSYQWSNGETSAAIDHLSAGTYDVSITDANGCEHVRSYEVPMGKRILPRSGAPVFRARVFPNPALAGQTVCTAEISCDRATAATLLLHDVLGRSVLTRDVELQEGRNPIPVVANLPPGVYTLFALGDFGKKELAKLVVE